MFRMNHHSRGRSQKVGYLGNAIETFHIVACIVTDEAQVALQCFASIFCGFFWVRTMEPDGSADARLFARLERVKDF